MAKVSIIIPVYNVEKYLKKCLDSVLAQTYSDFECIIINDGSTDMSGDIAKLYASFDKRIRVIEQENRGLSAARNVGIKAAKGEYIQFVDSDDFIGPELIEKCVGEFKDNNVDMVIFGFYEFYNNEQKREKKNIYKNNVTYKLDAQPDMLFKILPAAWNKMYKKSLFIENDVYYPEGRIYEDLGTTYRLLRFAEGVRFIDDALYYYRQLRDERISKNVDKKIMDRIYMMDETIRDYFESDLFFKYYEELKMLMIIHLAYHVNFILKKKSSWHFTLIAPIYSYVAGIFPDFPNCIYKDYYDDYRNSRLFSTKKDKFKNWRWMSFLGKLWIYVNKKNLPGLKLALESR